MSASSSGISCADATNYAIRDAMRADPNVVVYGLRVASAGGVHGTTQGLYEEFGRDRVMEIPLSEDSMTGAGVGMALAGQVPILVHMRTEFAILGMNQIINVASKIHHSAGIPLPFVVRVIVGRGWGQGPQHSQSLHSLWAHVPGLTVVAPVSPDDHAAAIESAVKSWQPTIIIEHRLLHIMDAKEWAEIPIRVGAADVLLVGVSHMAVECWRAAALVSEQGRRATAIPVTRLRPLDIEHVVVAAHACPDVIVVDNDWLPCGVSAEISAQLYERVPEVRVRRLGWRDESCPASPTLEEGFYPTPASIAKEAFK